MWEQSYTTLSVSGLFTLTILSLALRSFFPTISQLPPFRHNHFLSLICPGKPHKTRKDGGSRMQLVPSGSLTELPLAENLSLPNRPSSSPAQLCWRRICLGRPLSPCVFGDSCPNVRGVMHLENEVIWLNWWCVTTSGRCLFFCAGHNTLTSLGFQSRHAGERWIWSKHHFFCVGIIALSWGHEVLPWGSFHP